MQIEKRGLNRPPARSAPFRGKRIWRKFHLGGFHQRGSICPVWFESWQGKFAGGKQLLSKAPRLQTNQRNWSSTSVQIKNRQSTLSMYNITRIVISQWYLGADASMELLSSSNHSLFTKHLSLCKNFSCLSFLASLYLIIFLTSRSRSSVCFWTLRVFKCFTAKSLDCSGGWQDHLVWLTYHFTQSKSCSLLQTPLKYRKNAVVDKIVSSS